MKVCVFSFRICENLTLKVVMRKLSRTFPRVYFPPRPPARPPSLTEEEQISRVWESMESRIRIPETGRGRAIDDTEMKASQVGGTR